MLNLRTSPNLVFLFSTPYGVIELMLVKCLILRPKSSHCFELDYHHIFHIQSLLFALATVGSLWSRWGGPVPSARQPCCSGGGVHGWGWPMGSRTPPSTPKNYIPIFQGLPTPTLPSAWHDSDPLLTLSVRARGGGIVEWRTAWGWRAQLEITSGRTARATLTSIDGEARWQPWGKAGEWEGDRASQPLVQGQRLSTSAVLYLLSEKGNILGSQLDWGWWWGFWGCSQGTLKLLKQKQKHTCYCYISSKSTALASTHATPSLKIIWGWCCWLVEKKEIKNSNIQLLCFPEQILFIKENEKPINYCRWIC